MQAFQADFKPSKTGLVLTALLHIWAAAACLFAFYGVFRIIGLLFLSASFAWAWQVQKLRRLDAVHKIAVGRQGNAAVFVGSEQTAFTASLCAGSLISRYALFLKWDLGDRQTRQFILPDMTDRESYRRLLVWARWGQPKT